MDRQIRYLGVRKANAVGDSFQVCAIELCSASQFMASLKQSLDLTLFWEYRWVLFLGLVQNFLVFLIAGLIAVNLGFCVALARISRHWVLRVLGTLHVEIFRNV